MATPSIQRHSCANCARRKIKCNRLNPCSKCSRTQIECVYRSPVPSQRHRKRPADEELLSKIREYEILLRTNNVNFHPFDNSWVPSHLEKSLPEPAQQLLETQSTEQPSQLDITGGQHDTACLWPGLPKELRNPSIKQFERPGKDVENEVAEACSSPGIAMSLLMPVCTIGGTPKLLELHPAPKYVIKLWQAFAENVNPLTKVIHTPTLQQRILEVSWNLEVVTRPLEAVMFAIYALAITSMKSSECIDVFGETKSVLLDRYRSGVAQALIAAGLHSTKDLEVLQAFVLFLLLEPRSELSATAVATATRIGHRMGLHRNGTTDCNIPFFEQEMRLRVWWQIMCMESHARRKTLGLALPMLDFGDVRLPMNVNDADLHPNMTGRPTNIHHTGATEMVYCLLKYEIPYYVRSWVADTKAPTTTKNPYDLIASPTDAENKAMKNKVLAELEQIYEDKYLRHCDPRILLHYVAATVARLTILRLRFWYCHPRYQPDGGRHMSQADQDVVFETSIRILQLTTSSDSDGNGNGVIHDTINFSPHLLGNQMKCTEVEALVYVVSELRQRMRGGLVRTAWTLVESVYEEHRSLLLLQRDASSFPTALADLTLEAWDARKREVEEDGDAVVVPDYIRALQALKGNTDLEDASSTTAVIGGMISDEGFQLGLIHDDPLNWLYWDELS